jgi:chromosome segregation ATPase
MTVNEKKKLGRKPTLSSAEIIATIKKMQKDGDKISPSTIRSKITFGGLTNITSVLEKFLEEQNGTEVSINEPIENHVLSPELEDKVNMLINDISQQVNDFSIESDLLANNLAEKKARSAYDCMIENNRKLVDEQNLTVKIFDEVEAKNDELIEQITSIEAKLETEKYNSIALNSDLSKANDEQERLKLTISDLQTTLSTSEANNKTSDKLITKFETRLEDAVLAKDKAISESNKLRIQLTESNSKLKSSDEMTVQLKSDIKNVNIEKNKTILDLHSKNSNLSSKLQETQDEQQKIKEQLIKITAQITAQKETLNEKDNRITDLKKQLTKNIKE